MSEPSRRTNTGPDLDGATAPDLGPALAANERWLRRVIASRLGESQAVDEVMQDVAHGGRLSAVAAPGSARAAVWLYRLAVRHVLIYRRRTGRRRGLIDRYAARCQPSKTEQDSSPLAWLVRDERQELVQRAMATLGPRDAELLMLKYSEGFTATRAGRPAGRAPSSRSRPGCTAPGAAEGRADAALRRFRGIRP